MEVMLITGSSGMLGSAAIQYYKKKYKCVGVDIKPDINTNKVIDLSKKLDVNKLFMNLNPKYVLHCAAMIDVDKCENNKKSAENANVLSTYNLAQACKVFDSKLIYVSSNMVFDGKRETSYNELDEASPINFYGQTKYMGERMALKSKQPLIVRTNIVGLKENSFFHWINNEIKNDHEINLWEDVYFNAISVYDLVKYIELIINKHGIYHITSRDYISKLEFGKLIRDRLNKKTLLISSKYHGAIPRPKNAVLNCSKFENEMKINLPTIKQTIDQLYNKLDGR